MKRRGLAPRVKVQAQKEEDSIPALPVVVKASSAGTLNALVTALQQKQYANCALHIASSNIGNVNAVDVRMAEEFDGIVLAFDVAVDSSTQKLAKGIEI